MLERMLPANVHAERATLGSVLLDRDAIVPIAAWLQPGHFYNEKHGWVFEAMLNCYHRREPPDLTTVSDELRRQQRLDQIGDTAFLIDVSNAAPTAYHVEYYARIVERTAVLRQLIQVGGRIAALGYTEDEDVETVLNQAEQELFRVSQRPGTCGYVALGEVVDAYYTYLMRLSEGNDESLRGIPTGFYDFDRRTGGLQRTDLLILAARPGVGKSSLALCIAYNLAVLFQRAVGMFALEMGRDQLLQRAAAIHTGIDSQKLRTGRLSSRELSTLMDAMGQLHRAPIYIDDTAGISVNELRSKARRMRAEQGIDLLIVDYLQLMDGSTGRRGDNRVQEISHITQALKNLAKELDIPVLALSQLNREGDGAIPQLRHLREGGSIENDADIVMFIHREEMYDKDTDKKGLADLIFAKHRNGPLGTDVLFFDARTTRFRDVAAV